MTLKEQLARAIARADAAEAEIQAASAEVVPRLEESGLTLSGGIRAMRHELYSARAKAGGGVAARRCLEAIRVGVGPMRLPDGTYWLDVPASPPSRPHPVTVALRPLFRTRPEDALGWPTMDAALLAAYGALHEAGLVPEVR